MMNKKNQKGVSLIAAIFIIVVLAFMGVMFVSLINTGSLTSVNDMQSAQALYVAEGGVEFHQRNLAQNLDWYRSTTDPIATDTRTLGAGSGSFTVSTSLPATLLRNRIPNSVSTAPIRVYTTDRFPSSGYIQIEEDLTGSGEIVQYTGIATDTFTGITRGVAGVAGSHARGCVVYPVTTLVDALPNDCFAPASFRVMANIKFLSAGTIDIEGEEIAYTGSTTALPNMTLTGVQRCRNSTLSAIHAVGAWVTPLLADGTTPYSEAGIVSNGTVGNAARVASKTVQR